MTPLWDNFLRKIPPQSDCPRDLRNLLDSDVKDPFQRFLSQFVFKSNHEVLLAKQPTSREKLRVLAVSREHAGKWLHALPIKALNLEFESDAFNTLLRWWLGVPIFRKSPVQEDLSRCPEVRRSPFSCPLLHGKSLPPFPCDVPLDPLGDHAVSCHVGPFLNTRQNGVNLAWEKIA